MKPIYKRLLFFAFIILLAAAAAWIVYPKGSRITLDKLKLGKYNKVFKTHLGLDLQGGAHLVYQADFKDIKDQDKTDALVAVRDTIERRVTSTEFNKDLTISEPNIQTSGKDRVIVELPGITDVNKAIDQLGQTPFMEFRTIKDAPVATVDASGNAKIDFDNIDSWNPSGLSGKQLVKATADIRSQGSSLISGQPIVRLEFNDEGKKLFSELTTANVNKPIAIFLDGKLLSSPTVSEPITTGQAEISFNNRASVDEAKALATRLNSGALPVPIKLISQQTVGATLGKESVQKSIVAGIIGLLLIVLFMVIYYRFPGLLAVVALCVYALLSFAIFKIGISITAVILVGVFFFLGLTVSGWFGALALISYILLLFAKNLSPVTLTLAGIAGFILSIGMAVDANILIFERLKEEIRKGKSVSQSIDDGFARAWLSIRDSNVSSLITTVILYIFGTPAIKGFAVTLGIGIIISMFTAITITRNLLKLFVGNSLLNHPWLFGVSGKNTKDQ